MKTNQAKCLRILSGAALALLLAGGLFAALDADLLATKMFILSALAPLLIVLDRTFFPGTRDQMNAMKRFNLAEQPVALRMRSRL